jgi:hypothetical protein
MSTVTNISTDDLVSETELGTSTITMRLVGSAETDAKSALDVLLKGIHEAAIAAKVGEVVVDLRELEFMNSSCIKAFVSWIGAIQDGPASSQYQLRILSDSKRRWQDRSLAALACFAADLIHIETT